MRLVQVAEQVTILGFLLSEPWPATLHVLLLLLQMIGLLERPKTEDQSKQLGQLLDVAVQPLPLVQRE